MDSPGRQAEERLKVMGTSAHIVVRGADGVAKEATERLRVLERLWSRFLEDS